MSATDKEFLKLNNTEVNSDSLFNITLSYENFTYDQILSALLPIGGNGVGGFSIIGHIAHLNLRDELLEYKTVIGKGFS
jgi:tRNA (guanine37-N1)-methyltransferase